MQLDPKTAILANTVYAILTGLTAPMLQAAGIAHAEQVVAIAALAAFPLNIILHGYSSQSAGPLAK